MSLKDQAPPAFTVVLKIDLTKPSATRTSCKVKKEFAAPVPSIIVVEVVKGDVEITGVAVFPGPPPLNKHIQTGADSHSPGAL